jgi:imidazolonepropionase-like amidohydrolase
MRSFMLAALLLAPMPAFAQGLVITGATVYETPDKKLDDATIVVQGGKIVSVGKAAPPASAQVIDGRGKIVTAGLIESLTQVGLVTVELEPAAVDGRFSPDTEGAIHAAFRASDAYDARAVSVPVARTGGVTSVVASPLGGLLAGQSVWYPLVDASAPPAPVLAPAAMNAGLGADATSSGSRGIAVEQLREVLTDAQAYAKNRAGYDRNQSRKLAAARLDLEALAPVLAGRLPLVVRADGETDIRAALAIAREYKLRLVIAGGLEAWRVASELAAAKVPVILDPTRNLPLDMAALDARDDCATLLDAAGVEVVISTLGDGSFARTIRQLAGIAVAQGLPWQKGLAAITTAPAHLYGVTDRGVVKAGAQADLVVWSGDPLELSSRAEQVIVSGVVQGTISHQTRLFERYRSTP